MQKKEKEKFDILVNSKFQDILFYIAEKIYKNLNKLVCVPSFLFIIATFVFIYNFFTINSFFPKDFSLQGGLKITINYDYQIKNEFYEKFNPIYGNNLKMEKLGENLIITIVGNYDLETIKKFFKDKNIVYNLEEISPLLGKNFLKNLFITLLISFLFIAIVLKLVYKKWQIALSAIRALFFNIYITLAISTIFIPLSIITLPAYLMIIGYGIDTNINLINHFLKERKLGKLERYQLAFSTGITIILTTLTVLIVGIFISNNLVFKNIFFVLTIGLLVDLIDTWILNGYLINKIVK